MSDPTVRKIRYAAGHVLGTDVMSMSRDGWINLIHSDGTPTLLNEAPNPCREVMHDTMVVAVAASGTINPDPGFDIARHDPNDAPNIYNIDHYEVVEQIHLHPRYSAILKAAGIKDSPELQAQVAGKVFLILRDPTQTSDHWCKQLPHRINIARHKRSD